MVRTFSYPRLARGRDQAFFPYFAGPGAGAGSTCARGRSSASAFAAIRAAVAQVDPRLPVDGLRTVDDQLDRVARERAPARDAGRRLCELAVLLAVVGLYGVTSFVVTRRTREIGIRLALGATRGAALWLVLRDTARHGRRRASRSRCPRCGPAGAW